MSDPRSALIAVGDVIAIPEGDYHLGRGLLRMRVSHVPYRTGADLRDQVWVQVMGVEINLDGTDGRHRIALVRVAALVAKPPIRGNPESEREGNAGDS